MINRYASLAFLVFFDLLMWVINAVVLIGLSLSLVSHYVNGLMCITLADIWC